MMALAVFAIGVGLAVYAMAIYPAVLALGRSRRAPPVRKDLGHCPTVSVLLAVHNGERFLGDKLESLLGLEYPAGKVQIIVISDGSTDGTERVAGRFAPRGVQLVRVPRAGKAAALNASLRHAAGEILFFTDVRQKLDPRALAHLAANFADPTVGAVTGELRYSEETGAGEEADFSLYWRYELWARSRHSAIDSTFAATGCLYATRRSLVDSIPPDTLADDAVIPLRAFFRGYRVVMDPEALAFDYPTAPGGEFRRRLRTLAGLWQVFTRMPQLFTSRNRMRLHFLSHKFSRLILPWALVLAALATVALPHTWLRLTFLAIGAAICIAAAADYLIPQTVFLKRLTSPFRTFLAMNVAALVSPVVFIVPPGKLWGITRVKVRSAGQS
jgi:biofilm PGA synthesis N-glycosyltransferase PgaC